jgi:hypothetical protein
MVVGVVVSVGIDVGMVVSVLGRWELGNTNNGWKKVIFPNNGWKK